MVAQLMLNKVYLGSLLRSISSLVNEACCHNRSKSIHQFIQLILVLISTQASTARLLTEIRPPISLKASKTLSLSNVPAYIPAKRFSNAWIWQAHPQA
jgi:hypothetical protein